MSGWNRQINQDGDTNADYLISVLEDIKELLAMLVDVERARGPRV